MVICKYYRQGNCRYGQYCQFEHINHFGNNKTEDDIVVLVAKEVLFAERGGQWLLSCFGPLKERPCIPGMEDMSPEEVRWEMYHAQKNGVVEQAKLHFQQLCQDMKAKREALKNPTRETITTLKKILGSGQKAPQLGLVSNASTNNVFGSTSYGVQSNNPFGGGGGFTSSNNTSSIFGKSSSNAASVFGGAPTFGNNLGGLGTATSGAGSTFLATRPSTFINVQSNARTFGTSQNNPIFGAPSPSVFGQSGNVFGGTAQLGNASNTMLFNNPITSQASASPFGGATTTTASLFGSAGSSAGLPTNSVFGGPTTPSSGSYNGGMFSQPKTQIPAFGGAPVFAGVTSYAGSSAGGSMLGVGQQFGAPAISAPSGIFGGSTAAAMPAFGAPAAGAVAAAAAAATPGFGAASVAAAAAPVFDLSQQPGGASFGTAVSAPNVFGTQNTSAAMPAGNAAPFGVPSAAISSPFVTAGSQQFDPTSTSSAPFAGAGFGMAVASANNMFGTTETSSNTIFANAGTTFATPNGTVSNPPPYPALTFGGGVNVSAPFGPTVGAALTATATANPFAPRAQQGGTTPFVGGMQSQPGTSPFVKSPFNVAASIVIDDSVYSADGTLTDDEKSMFLAEKFILGKIPLKPPTKDIR